MSTPNALRALALGGLALACAPATQADPSWELEADTWSRPRSGRAVASMQPVAQAVRAWADRPGSAIVILYPGGETGTLWAAELRDWLVALGVPSDHIRLTAGGARVACGSNYARRSKPNMHRVAAIQMASGPNVQANLDRAGEFIQNAVDRGARLVALPENFGLIGASESVKLDHAEADGRGPMQDFLAATAARHGIWLVGGTVPIATPSGERIRQSLGVYDEQGRRVARYDKAHLFDVTLDGGETYRESATIEPGGDVVVVDSPIGKLGLTICYDLRFPELYRRLVDEGAEVLLVPSAFTKQTGRAHWEILTRARAIENLAFVIAPAQGGYHVSERETWGHTMIVDPWGTVLALRENGAGAVVADLDPQMLRRTRKNFPAVQHRRFT